MGIQLSWGCKVLLGGLGPLKGTPSLLCWDKPAAGWVRGATQLQLLLFSVY